MHIKFSPEAAQIMDMRFGCDNLIALATVDESGTPWVRNVNAYYENGSFYVITNLLSNKMQHIKANPVVAISGDWFTAHGRGENLGYILKAQNLDLIDKLRTVFGEWYDNGHINEAEINTVILRIRLTNGVLFNNGTRYDLEF
ncbi:MAG: pyridoxamine 5'-phosphate oxidase family protein [Clostridia bacterium]|nr:pyridoxamine 5'-phosphate oxidase family protein [Clostridia bacterium]